MDVRQGFGRGSPGHHGRKSVQDTCRPNQSLSVQSTQTWSIHGFCTRNRNYGLGYILHVGVLGPLGSYTAGKRVQYMPGLQKYVNMTASWALLRGAEQWFDVLLGSR